MQAQYEHSYKELQRAVMMITPGMFRLLDVGEEYEPVEQGQQDDEQY